MLTHYALYIVWCTELDGITDVTSTCTCTSIHSHQHDVDPGPLKLQIYTTAEHAQCSPVVQSSNPLQLSSPLFTDSRQAEAGNFHSYKVLSRLMASIDCTLHLHSDVLHFAWPYKKLNTLMANLLSKYMYTICS